ncbi:MAG: hypothetical protein IJU75_01470 [Clostridia bacterium]|nr:hypothetical protein [Clostridia bacterium]
MKKSFRSMIADADPKTLDRFFADVDNDAVPDDTVLRIQSKVIGSDKPKQTDWSFKKLAPVISAAACLIVVIGLAVGVGTTYKKAPSIPSGTTSETQRNTDSENTTGVHVPVGEQSDLIVSTESNVFDESDIKTDEQNNGLTDNTRQSEFSIEEQIVIDKVGDSIVFDKANDDSPTFLDYNPKWNEMSFKAEDISQSRTVEFGGKQITGVYSKSRFERYNSKRTDFYSSEEGYQFAVFAETGKIERLNFQNNAFFDNEANFTNQGMTMEEIESKARGIAESIIGDVSKYEHYVEQREPGTIGADYCFVTFYREIGGFRTSDYITVKMSLSGVPASVIVGDTGVLDNVLSVDINNDALISSIRDRVAEQVNGTDGYTFVDGSAAKQFLALMPEGDYCIVTEYEFRFSEVGVDEPYSSGVRVLTKIS